MRILAVDVGTGTQDILLFDSSSVVENCVKMIMPSPTVLVARRIEAATRRGHPILMEGAVMGGGPSRKALSRHTAAGLAAYATREAALTFHDDLDLVRGMGVTLVSAGEASSLKLAASSARPLEVIPFAGLDMAAIRGALAAFGVEPRFDAVGVAVLDHGLAPGGTSNRLFRFRCLRQLLGRNPTLGAFALTADEVFDAGGHGAMVISQGRERPFLAAAGPRQDIVRGVAPPLHPATPHGDTMLTGCYGLVKAFGLRMESWREEIDHALAPGG